MAKMKWTPAQSAAIDDRGGSLLVSAAAGSGKTAVLTERVVSLLQDTTRPVQADRLLIVTFTNAAAAELRARIAARLEQVIAAHPLDNNLRRQKMLLQRANICTIDAYCLRLLQQHFTALNLPPDFSLADAGAAGQLKSQALAQTLEEAYQDSDFCAFIDMYGKGRSDGAASAAILQLYDFLRTMPNAASFQEYMLAQWTAGENSCIAIWCEVLQSAMADKAILGTHFAEMALTRCQQDFQDALATASASRKTAAAKEKACEKVEAKYAKIFAVLGDLCDVFTRVSSLMADASDWDTLYDILTPYRTGALPMPGLKGTGIRLSGTGAARAKSEADQASAFFAQIINLTPCNLAQEATDRALAQPRIAALFRAQQRFATLFLEKKLEKKILEFADIEHFALQLLARKDGKRTPLAQSIANSFDAVMVDEYQDTNKLQEQIYRGLANEAGDNLFFVGDLKQSIYRFRQAEPSIFADKLHLFAPLEQGAARPTPPEGTHGKNGQIALDANFRSASAVVEGINFIFGEIMSAPLGGTHYGDGQRLVCQSGGAIDGSVSVLLDTEGEQDPAQIADKIEHLVALGAAGDAAGMVRDGDGVRPIAYEDCCILLSTRAPFARYAAALAAKGIAVNADSSEDLLSAVHVAPLVALLQIIDNPAQDIPLMTVMRSVLFGFTDDDFVALRLHCRKGGLYGAVVQVARAAQNAAPVGVDAHIDPQAQHEPQNTAPVEVDAHIDPHAQHEPQNTTPVGVDAHIDPQAQQALFLQKIAVFYETLSALRRLSHTLAPEELLAEIFATTHYLALVGAMEQGQRRRDDVAKFAAYVASAGANGIESLVHNLTQTQASGGLVDTAPSKIKRGCVTIMTIHRSKGLQFPVVFVANLDHQFNTDDLKRKMLLHNRFGLGVQLRAGTEGSNYPTLASVALQQLIKTDIYSEEMRLLYVALTRAQDHLYLCGTAKNLDKRIPELAYTMEGTLYKLTTIEGCLGTNCFMEWVLRALLRHPDASALRTHARGVALTTEPAAHLLHIEQYAHVKENAAQAVATATDCATVEQPAAAQTPATAAQNLATVATDTAAQDAATPTAPKGISAAPDAALVQTLVEGFGWQYPHAALSDLPAKVSVTSLVHKEQATILSRPAFLQKDGMTAAEKGTALHAFLENADFAAMKAARQQGAAALKAALTAERTRQEAERRMPPHLAEKLDMASVEVFFAGEAFARIAAASEIHREYDFITGLPASEVLAATAQVEATQGNHHAPEGKKNTLQSDISEMQMHETQTMTQCEIATPAVPQSKTATVLVQGIADLLLVYPDHLELLDYKSDHRKKEADYRAAYAKQLEYYAKAIEKRFAPLKITYKAIYSFDLGKLIEV